MNEKIDIHNTDHTYKKGIEVLKRQVSKKNYQLVMDYINASAIGKTARKNAGKKQVSTRARQKNMYLLKIICNFIKKDLNKLNQKDMEKIIFALNENKIRKINKEKYSEQTKSNIKKTLISLLRWIHKNNEKYRELTDWIETRFKKKEIPALMEEDIKKLLNSCNTLHQKVLIAGLFDTGARIEEFLNIRIGDLIEVKGNIPYYKLTIRNEFSKTKGRTIGLFWKPTTEIIKQLLEIHPDKTNLSAPLITSTYDGVRQVLYKLGKRTLKRTITPHLFRHSSATYYANQGLDYYKLCKRYGWNIGSKQPFIYIDRAGIEEREIADKFQKKHSDDLLKEIEILKQENKMIKDNQDKMARALLKLKRK